MVCGKEVLLFLQLTLLVVVNGDAQILVSPKGNPDEAPFPHFPNENALKEMPNDVLEEQKNVDPKPSAFEFAPTPSGRSLEILSISGPAPEKGDQIFTFSPTPSGSGSSGSGRPTSKRTKIKSKSKSSLKTATSPPLTETISQSLAERLSEFTQKQEEENSGSGSFIPTPPTRRPKKKDRKQRRKKVHSSETKSGNWKKIYMSTSP